MAYDAKGDMAPGELEAYLKAYIRDIPDFPVPGILFRDITTLLLDPAALRRTINALSAPYMDGAIDMVAGVEARGFILGGAVAAALGAGFIPIRKPGKLPGEILRQDYCLEYGSDAVEVHCDALGPGARVLLVDDLIATGGTAEAALTLIRRAGAVVEAAAFVIDLPDLGGRRKIEKCGCKITTLCSYRGL